jgi:hypothetical protein
MSPYRRTLEVKEAEYWQAKLTDISRTELDKVRATAAKWQATISTLLGVFGSIAFVGGISNVDQLNERMATTAKNIVTVAVVLAFLAILGSAYAAMGVPRKHQNQDWRWLRDESHTRARHALLALRLSQVGAVAAAILIVTGSLTVLRASPAQPSGSKTYAVIADGKVWCVDLSTHKGRTTYSSQGAQITIPGKITSIVEVSGC